MRCALTALVSTACLGQERLPIDVGGEALVFAITDLSQEQRSLFAVDPLAPAIPAFTVRDEDRFFVLAYPITLGEVLLAPGEIQIVSEEPSRPIPPGFSAYEIEGVETRPIDEAAFREAIGDLRLRAPAKGACEMAGGCFQVANAALQCKIPCTLPAVSPPAPPDEPSPPDFGACPPGWSSSEGACAPPARISCSTGEAQFLGDAACSSVAGACPARFPAGLGGTVAYVDPAVPGPGAGTEVDPFSTIDLALAGTADTIALARGTISSPVNVTRDVTIAGACRDSEITGTLTVSAEATLRNLRIGTARIAGALTLDGVEVAGVVDVEATGRLFTTGTLFDTTSSGIDSGGAVEVRRTVFLDADSTAIAAGGGSVLAEDVVVGARRRLARGAAGISAQGTITVTVTRLAAHRNDGPAVSLDGATATGRLEWIVADDSAGDYIPDKYGIAFLGGASGSVDHAFLRKTGSCAVRIVGGTVAIRDAVVIDAGRPALYAGGGATVTAERFRAANGHAAAIRILSGAAAELSDVRVEGVARARVEVEGESPQMPSDGILFDRATPSSLDRAFVSGVERNGVDAFESEVVTLSNVTVEGTGVGIALDCGPSEVSRTRVSSTTSFGVQVRGEQGNQVIVNLEDLQIERTGDFGLSTVYATLDGARIRVSEATRSGIDPLVSSWMVTDLEVSDTTTGRGVQLGTNSSEEYGEASLTLTNAVFDEGGDAPCLRKGYFGTFTVGDVLLTRCSLALELIVPMENLEHVAPGFVFFDNDTDVQLP